jgi:spermidine synthase
MDGLKRIKSIHEFIEVDREQGVERTYIYDSRRSHHIHTHKQEVDILESSVWGKMLFIDRTLQSTSRDEIIYHSALVHPLMDALDNRAKILILGGAEGATAREVLRWNGVEKVVQVDYDEELVAYMKKDLTWSKGAYNDKRLTCFYEDAWAFIGKSLPFNGIIVDLTDPDVKREDWNDLLFLIMSRVAGQRGGFVINAGLYVPWNVDTIKTMRAIVEKLCTDFPGYRYHIYTAMIPSFNGEWTFIAVTRGTTFMKEPEHLMTIPTWIRRQIRTLTNTVIDTPSGLIAQPSLEKIY